MNTYTIAFDVGGLFIKSAVLNQDGDVIPNSYAIFPSKSKQSKNEIMEHLVFIIKEQVNRILDINFKINGVGYAFPGPFDYKNGISYIKNVDKFDDLYEVNLRDEIYSLLIQDATIKGKMTNDFQIRFENDANLFALGENIAGKGTFYNKTIFLTIGTGAGSAFIESGKLITNRADVPENGWIYNQPFKESIVDDYVSKRGILQLAREVGILTIDDEVKVLADMAQNGDKKAKEVFNQFGENIGHSLHPYVNSFNPEAIIIGGQIAKSMHLFIDGINKTLGNKSVKVECSNETSLSTFIGIAQLLKQSLEV